MWEKNETDISGLYVLHPFCSEDNRGNFIKIFEKDIFDYLNLPNDTSEIFISKSKPGVIRGMHFQYTNPQTKFVSAMRGRIFDVAIDLRMGSSSFGKWYAEELTEENHKVFAIPAGFAHGFQVIGDSDALVIYQCVGKYDKKSDFGIIWNDSEICIDWPIKDGCTISDRDRQQMTFDEFKKNIVGL